MFSVYLYCYQLYEKESGGIDVIKLVNFYNKFIKNKYKNHLIILDNANFHKSTIIKEAVEKSDNKIIYILPYNPDLNPIENLFSQLKNYIRNKSPGRKTIKNYSVFNGFSILRF
jgi:transposase